MIKVRLTTEREFKSRDEMKDYCESMIEQSVYTDEFWLDLYMQNQAAFSSLEPRNGTIVTTEGLVEQES